MTPRPASAALTPLDAALRLLLGLAAPVAPRRVAVTDAIGAVAAEDVIALADAPGGAVALRDGWAVSADAVIGASPYSPVAPAPHPAWVDAGGALPPGADTVLPPEALEGGEIVADAPAGDGARAIGAEIAAGDRLATAGARLTALQALALTSAGVTEIAVRAPRIRLLVAENAALSVALAAWIGPALADVAYTLEEPGALAAAIAAEGCDAVFVLSGEGIGRSDLAAAALAGAGSLAAHGIALNPGEATGFGSAGGRPVLLLPGRPDAALAAFLTLGRPLLAKLSGAAPATLVEAALTRKVASAIGLSEIVFVRRVPGGVEPLGGADLPLRRMILADGAILAPPEREGWPEGALVEIIPL